MQSTSLSEHLLQGMASQVAHLAKQVLTKLERIPALTSSEKQELVRTVLLIRSYQHVLHSGVSDESNPTALLLESQKPSFDLDKYVST